MAGQGVGGTVKYLSPVQDQKSLSDRAADDWKSIEPALSAAGSVSQALSPVPGIGAVAAGAAPLLSALGKLQVGTVPQGANGFEWYVEKVTTAGVEGRGILQGVMWSLPKKMFEELGGRLTGSLAVSFIPCPEQGSEDASLRKAPLRAHAGVFPRNEQALWAPSQTTFLELQLEPQSPGGAN